MYDRIVAYIYSNMSTVAYDISRLCFGKAYFISAASLSAGRMWQADSERCVDRHNESGAVRTVGKTGTTVYIRVTDELTCITCYCLSI